MCGEPPAPSRRAGELSGFGKHRWFCLAYFAPNRCRDQPQKRPVKGGFQDYEGLGIKRSTANFEACSLPTIEVARKQRLMEPPQCAHKWCFLRWSSTWDPPFLLVP